MALLLGEDGNGFDLARRLESHGIWRSWLGDSLYSNFNHCLSSPSSWDSFMRSDETKSRVQIQLQLRVRALLFDKATLSLFLRAPSSASSSHIISKLNPNYLQLHGDDLYFTLEDVERSDGGVVASDSAPSKAHATTAFGIGSRYSESEIDSMSQRFNKEDFPATWYSQFIEKHKSSRPYFLSSFNCDSDSRSPSEMFNYLRNLEKHKRRRVSFKGDPSVGFGNSNVQLGSALDGDASDDETFFPETMVMNCVPDIAIVPFSVAEEKHEVEFYGVLDRLPRVASKNSIMIERLGISMDQGPGSARTRVASEENRRRFSHEQALLISKKLIARSLATIGFEGASEVPVEVFSQLLSCHISKLGSTLRVLADSYRKKCSAIELIRMFLRVSGHGNLTSLGEYIKDGRNVVHQSPQQQVQSIQSQLPITLSNGLHMPQVPRPMQQQMTQQMLHNLTPQQQQQLLRMRRPAQLSSTRPPMDNDRSLVEVKLEKSEIPMDNNAFSMMNARQQQPLQHLRQQQLVPPIQRYQPQIGAQHRQLSPLQMAQMQTANLGHSRAQPVKVEGFQELMGGDSGLNSDEGRLTSPSK